MIGPIVKSGCQKDRYYDEIGLCAQTKDTILGSLINTIRRAYVPLTANKESSFFTF